MFFMMPRMGLYLVLMVPAMVLIGWAQYKVKSAYARNSQISAASGMTGARLARDLLDGSGLADVDVQPIAGELTDNYDPRDKVLRLSEGVFDGRSVAAQGIVAHEVGHAVQDARGYVPLKLRASLVPAAQFGSSLGPILVIVGVVLAAGGAFSQLLIQLGIVFFAAAVVFQIVTLPVEFNASRRALVMLSDGGYLTTDEYPLAKQVLSAAALTYLAATLAAVMQLVYYLLISRRD